jgi:hypothetical protein
MKLRFFAVPALVPGDAEGEVNRFLGSHRVVSVERHLVTQGGEAYWALCVSYLDGEGRASAPVKGGKIDYKEVLSPEDFAILFRLRNRNRDNNLGFRLARAQTRAGVPAPDPAAVPSVREIRITAGSEHPWGRWCADRAVDAVASARQRPVFYPPPGMGPWP